MSDPHKEPLEVGTLEENHLKKDRPEEDHLKGHLGETHQEETHREEDQQEEGTQTMPTVKEIESTLEKSAVILIYLMETGQRQEIPGLARMTNPNHQNMRVHM